jgi:cytochrome oxidase Cu insertion factor (SCO1/SenC/PrrC family)
MRLPLLVTGLVVILGAGAAWLVSSNSRTHHDGRVDLPAAEADAPPDFTLLDCDGRTVTTADLRNQVCLIYFGFTTCPDVCPTELGWMVRVMRQLGPLAAQVRPVFITIDPERDTPAKLTAYAQAFHPRMLPLTGSAEQIAHAAASFGVVYRKQTPVSQQAGFYLIDHTMTTFVLGRDGRIVHRYTSADVEPAKAAAQIRALAGGSL